MPSAKPDYWFAVKRYGWGWGMPVRWQGWLVLVAYLGLVYVGIYSFVPSRSGYALAIYPSMTSLVAAAAMEKALRTLKDEGVSQAPGIDMFDFGEFCKLIGFEQVWDFEKRWAR